MENKAEYNRYNNAKVCKLVNTVDETFYIGSTCNTLARRLGQHKTNARKEDNFENKAYNHLRKVGLENLKIILLNEFYLENKDQLLREENNYIEMYKNDTNCLNSRFAIRDKEEYYKEYRAKNRDKLIEKHKEYRENNKTKISEYGKLYRELNKEKIMQKYQCTCGSTVRCDGKKDHENTIKHRNFLNDLREEAQTI